MQRIPREWLKCEYHDPKVVLPSMRSVREDVSRSGLSDKVRNLRTNSLKKYRESWDIAIFCDLISRRTGVDFRFCPVEGYDYDAVFYSMVEQRQYFVPVQLKELVPKDLNPEAELKAVLGSLTKYADSEDLVVAIKLNQDGHVSFEGIDTKRLPVGEVWCFGCASSDGQSWHLFGEIEGGKAARTEHRLGYV